MGNFGGIKVYPIFYANLAYNFLILCTFTNSMRNIIFVTLILFISSCVQSPAKQQQDKAPAKATKVKNDITVAIQPMDCPDTNLCGILAAQITLFYGFKAEILTETGLPECSFYKSRNRYRADTILHYLLRIRPEKYAYMIGLTDKDISCTKEPYEDWGVFGLGFMPGKSCVISTFRLKRNMKSEEHFQERVIKVVLHELGHNIGLDHCPTPKCMMQDAEGTIRSVDEEKIEVCTFCKAKIQKFRETHQ